MTGRDPDRLIDVPGYRGPERRHEVHITEAQIDRIAEAAARKAVDRMIQDGYRAIGKTVVDRGLILIGALVAGFIGWAVAAGWIKLPR